MGILRSIYDITKGGTVCAFFPNQKDEVSRFIGRIQAKRFPQYVFAANLTSPHCKYSAYQQENKKIGLFFHISCLNTLCLLSQIELKHTLCELHFLLSSFKNIAFLVKYQNIFGSFWFISANVIVTLQEHCHIDRK